jgi:cytoplasmic iron level regulating protein YaaA (DUF328/UPF0246 family)
MDLLILSCSATRRPDAGTMPALDRYDGPSYRVLRKCFREQPENHLGIWIVSAEFGLITGDTPIPAYDRRMTMERATELHSRIVEQFRMLREEMIADRVLLHMSPVYHSAIAPIRSRIESLSRTPLHETSGGIGVRLGQLKRWLYQ